MNAAKQIILSFTLLSFGLFANAQKGNLSTSSTIGVTAPLLDNGIGFHLGINPSQSILSSFSLEGQLSFMHTKISSSFLTGKTGRTNFVNILLGGRLYLNSAEKTNRFYVNLLVGGNYNKEETNRVQHNGELNLGISSGAFLELNKFLIGVSYETPQNIILKIGYVFK